MLRRSGPWMLALLVVCCVVPVAAAEDRARRLISLLESGKPAVGVWTTATAAPRIAKVLATSDADYIVADIERAISAVRYGLGFFPHCILGKEEAPRQVFPEDCSW